MTEAIRLLRIRLRPPSAWMVWMLIYMADVLAFVTHLVMNISAGRWSDGVPLVVALMCWHISWRLYQRERAMLHTPPMPRWSWLVLAVYTLFVIWDVTA